MRRNWTPSIVPNGRSNTNRLCSPQRFDRWAGPIARPAKIGPNLETAISDLIAGRSLQQSGSPSYLFNADTLRAKMCRRKSRGNSARLGLPVD